MYNLIYKFILAMDIQTNFNFNMKKAYNFKIFIKKDTRTGTNQSCYSSYIPEFGISADGDNINEVIKNTEKLLKFHIESLLEEGEEIHDDSISEAIVYDSSIIIDNA